MKKTIFNDDNDAWIINYELLEAPTKHCVLSKKTNKFYH